MEASVSRLKLQQGASTHDRARRVGAAARGNGARVAHRWKLAAQRPNENSRLASRSWNARCTARSRFYASMSHELRTPINAILGYSSLLLDNMYGPLNEKQSDGHRAHAPRGAIICSSS